MLTVDEEINPLRYNVICPFLHEKFEVTQLLMLQWLAALDRLKADFYDPSIPNYNSAFACPDFVFPMKRAQAGVRLKRKRR